MSRFPLLSNWFVGPLIAVGVLFCLTAWLCTLGTVQAQSAAAAASPMAELSRLMAFVRDWGVMLLVVELALLALCVVGVILTDRT